MRASWHFPRGDWRREIPVFNRASPLLLNVARPPPASDVDPQLPGLEHDQIDRRGNMALFTILCIHQQPEVKSNRHGTKR